MLYYLGELEEDSRPTLYRSLKYWGKKPHNIWRELIRDYTQVKDIVYDPFAGSALTFFESIKIGRKPLISDINPLTLFIVEVYSQNYDYEKLIKRFSEIEKIVSNTKLYKDNYKIICNSCGYKTDIYNYRWNNDKPESYSYKCSHCGKTITINETRELFYENFGLWKPNYDIKNFSSVCASSLKGFGGDNITDIYSKRNLELLSLIYNLIKKSSIEIQLPLIFAFIQTLHLTTKMCALRSELTNRPLSTSWGRPAYMFLKKHMEQNPLIQFKRSLFEKNGVIKALQSRKKYLPSYTFSTNISDINKVDGIVNLGDSKQLSGFKSKLIITDPPYGPIIQYGELSMIWNSWLENFNEKYKTDLTNEIIINKEKNYTKYIKNMVEIFDRCNDILEGDLFIMTFNSNNVKDWDAINEAIKLSNFNIKYRYLQKNKRSSEANVKISNELAISDHYFILEPNKHPEQEYITNERLISLSC